MIFLISGFERIVYPSSLGASPEATFIFVRDHWLTEEHVRASGLRHTFLSDNFHQDVLPALAETEGINRRYDSGACGQRTRRRRWRATT